MLPPKCITCGKFLADIEIEWIQYEEQCISNKQNSKTHVADLLSKKLDNLHLTSRCCRSQVLTYVKLIKIIL